MLRSRFALNVRVSEIIHFLVVVVRLHVRDVFELCDLLLSASNTFPERILLQSQRNFTLSIVSRIVILVFVYWVFARSEDASNISMCGLSVLGHVFLERYEVSCGIHSSDSVWTIENRHSCDAALLLLPTAFRFLITLIQIALSLPQFLSFILTDY